MTVQLIPITDIDIDNEWNCRSEINTSLRHSSETDDESTGLDGLVANLLTTGQITPVDVRPVVPPFYKLTSKPYSLVCGFRRTAALSTLYANKDLEQEAIARAVAAGLPAKDRQAIKGIPWGFVRATIHPPLTEREAFVLNSSENTNRSQLSPPEIFAIVSKGLKVHKMTAADLCIALGKTPSSVANYVRLTKLPKPILRHWQSGGEYDGIQSQKRIGIQDLFVMARLPDASEQEAAYKKALVSQARKIESSAWIEKARGRAVAMGTLFARLEREGFLTTHVREWLGHIDVIVRTGKRELKMSDAHELARLAEEAYTKEKTKGEKPAPKSNLKAEAVEVNSFSTQTPS